MSDRDLRNLYENVRRGDEYVAPKRESELYSHVLNNQENNNVIEEATVTVTLTDGTTQTVEITDSNAKELQNVLKLPLDRNSAFFKTNDGWDSYRTTQDQAHELSRETGSIADKGRLLKKIKMRAAESTAIANVQERTLSDVVQDLLKFVMDTADRTMKIEGESINQSVKANQIMSQIESGVLQRELIGFMGSVGKSKFNLWAPLEGKQSTHTSGAQPIHFDLERNPDMKYLKPFDEAKKARGAAGPGESLLSFIYGGQKPDGAGDIQLNSNTEHTIELKFNQGRIGKGIKGAKPKSVTALFIKGIDQAMAYFGGNNKNNPIYKVQNPMGEDEYLTYEKLKNLSEDEHYKIYFNASTGLPLAKLKIKQSEVAGAFAHGSSVKINTEDGDQTVPVDQMTVQQFKDAFSGIQETGKYKDEPWAVVNYGGEFLSELLVDALKQIPGNTDKNRVENLIGVFHLKNYLTHIAKFKWLVVYNESGDAVSVTSDDILKLDPIQLLTRLGESGLKFYPRDDASGFDIRFI